MRVAEQYFCDFSHRDIKGAGVGCVLEGVELGMLIRLRLGRKGGGMKSGGLLTQAVRSRCVRLSSRGALGVRYWDITCSTSARKGWMVTVTVS